MVSFASLRTKDCNNSTAIVIKPVVLLGLGLL